VLPGPSVMSRPRRGQFLPSRLEAVVSVGSRPPSLVPVVHVLRRDSDYQNLRNPSYFFSTRCVITGTQYARHAASECSAKSLVATGGRGDQGGIHTDRVKAAIGQRSTQQSHVMTAVIRVMGLGGDPAPPQRRGCDQGWLRTGQCWCISDSTWAYEARRNCHVSPRPPFFSRQLARHVGQQAPITI